MINVMLSIITNVFLLSLSFFPSRYEISGVSIVGMNGKRSKPITPISEEIYLKMKNLSTLIFKINNENISRPK